MVLKEHEEGLGSASACMTLEAEPNTCMLFDAAAVLWIVERKSLGKVRHIDTDVLCLLEKQTRRLLPINGAFGA